MTKKPVESGSIPKRPTQKPIEEKLKDTAKEVQNDQQPEAFVIPTPVVLALLNYLAQRPFVEVQELIPALQSLSPHG